MLRRNLIYTGITRSKKFLIICGEEAAFQSGVNRLDDAMRQTTLASRLQESQGEVQMVTVNGEEMDVETFHRMISCKKVKLYSETFKRITLKGSSNV